MINTILKLKKKINKNRKNIKWFIFSYFQSAYSSYFIVYRKHSIYEVISPMQESLPSRVTFLH